VTLARLVIVGALAASLFAGGTEAWPVVALAPIALALDGVDGWLARRGGLVSAFGARFDMETDSAFALVLSLHALATGAAGPVVLVLGVCAVCLPRGRRRFAPGSTARCRSGSAARRSASSRSRRSSSSRSPASPPLRRRRSSRWPPARSCGRSRGTSPSSGAGALMASSIRGVARLVVAALVLHLVLIQPNHPAAATWGALAVFPLELPVILLGAGGARPGAAGGRSASRSSPRS
jgi:hypothetical protein